ALAAVAVLPGRAAHRLREMFVANRVDPAFADGIPHQRDQVVPDGRPLWTFERSPRQQRVDVVAEQDFGSVHVAYARDDGLIEQQTADRSAGLGDPGPGTIGVGVPAQRVGAEPGT